MNRIDETWRRLVTTARSTPTEEVVIPPTAFVTRVVARWQATTVDETLLGGLGQLFAWRAVGVACGLTLVSALYCWQVGALDPPSERDFWMVLQTVEWEVMS